MLKDLEGDSLEYEITGKFLADLKRKFGGGDEEMVKVAELKRIEQGEKTIKEFIQEFQRVARGSGYEGRPLVEEFKRGMNGTIWQKLMKSECQPSFIEQWYDRTIALNRNQKKRKREEERLKGERTGTTSPKTKPRRNTTATMAKTLDMAKKTGDLTTVGAGRASSNRRSRENKYGDSIPYSEDRIGTA